MEQVGYDPLRIHSTVHTKANNHMLNNHPSNSIIVNDAISNFKIYTLELNVDYKYIKRRTSIIHLIIMYRLLTLFLLIFISLTSSWPIRKPKLKLNSNNTCCILAKLNINATRANYGREFFANLILNNNSY